uniref:Uncharacterized protein n=1 Tax=Triticum urartu TaxID=4572 RepID=A0A8R7R2L3_TRIUA
MSVKVLIVGWSCREVRMPDGSGTCRLKQQELAERRMRTGSSTRVVREGSQVDSWCARRSGRQRSFDGRTSRSKEPTVVNFLHPIPDSKRFQFDIGYSSAFCFLK